MEALGVVSAAMTDARTFDLSRMRSDIAVKGWLPTDLAKAAGVSDMTVSRFLSGSRQNPRTAKKLASALGYSVRRYVAAHQAVSA